METHETDPKAESGADPWDRVSGEFGELRHRLKETYRKAADESGPSEDEVRDAFETLSGAWGRVASSVTAALKDPEVRDRLKQAASSFASAMGTTMKDLSAELGDDAGSEEE